MSKLKSGSAIVLPHDAPDPAPAPAPAYKPVTRTISVDYLARVEGEGGLQVKVKSGKVTDVRLNIFEPPRFFEQNAASAIAPWLPNRACA